MLRTGRFRLLAVVEGSNSTKGVHRRDSYLGGVKQLRVTGEDW